MSAKVLFLSPPPFRCSASSSVGLHHKRTHRVSSCYNTPTALHPLLSDAALQKHFIRTIWSKKPHLLRTLVTPQDNLTRDDLAYLSTQYPSRLITGHGDGETDGPYTLQVGPFSDETLESLPHENWTLLVDHVNRYVPSIADLLDRFRFLPHWRLDDVMVSYAPPGGSVGPHVDNYDVFLIQAAGRRLWRTSYTAIDHANEELVSGSDVRILRGGFDADEEWVLEPGDALYVPPRYPHYGISLDEDCMTYSIGFRAPSVANLVAGWTERIIERRGLETEFYQDDIEDLAAHMDDPALLSKAAIDRAYNLVLRHFSQGDETRKEFGIWFAEEVSQSTSMQDPAEGLQDDQRNLDVLLDKLLAHPRASGNANLMIRQREGTVFTYFECNGVLRMYIDGQQWPVENMQIASAICSTRQQIASEYAKLSATSETVRPLLRDLFEAGLLYVEEDAVAYEDGKAIEDGGS